MDNATFISLLNKQGDDLKDFIKATNSLQNARMINQVGPIEDKVDQIIEQNMVRNGRLEEAEDDISELQVHCENTDKVFGWIGKRWYIVLLAFVALNFMTAWTYYRIDIHKTIENTTGVKIIDKETVTNATR